MSEITKPLCVLVDGSSYLFRAYHALPPLTTAQHEPTGAMYGVLNMLNKIQEEMHPEKIAVVFDTKTKNFRHEIYPEYKANRAAMADDLAVQIEPLYQIIRARGLPLIVEEGIEADDVIATMADKMVAAGYTVVISTGDKDMAQLVNDHMTLVNTMTGTVMDKAMVFEKFGVHPEQIPDYLALMGDTVDNIPGVRGVGPKTAAKWLQQFGSLSHILEHHADITGKAGEALKEALPWLPISMRLVTLQRDLPLHFTVEALSPLPADRVALQHFYTRYEFKTWLKRLSLEADANSTLPNKNDIHVEIIDDLNALEQWLEKIQQKDFFAVDTETTSLNYLDAKLVGIALSADIGGGAYIPLAHKHSETAMLPIDIVLEKLKPILENPRIGKIGHHLKYDFHVFSNYGIEMQGIRYDTMLESYLFNSVAGRHDLGSVARRVLNVETIQYEDVVKEKTQGFDSVDIPAAAAYSVEDAELTLRIHQKLYPELCKHQAQRELYEHIEIPLISVLAKMERAGILLDVKKLSLQSIELGARIVELEKIAHELAGQTFNLGSPKQLQEILFEKFKLPVLEKTPTGQPSTAESVLQALSYHYELPKVITEFRQLSKLKSTYTDKLPQMVNATTHRLHTSFHQSVTATGRLSSSDPNLQNIPIRTDEGKKIRAAFIAAPGYALLSCDYSQVELRIMAHLSEDPVLIEAFMRGLDVHRATASEIFHKTFESITDNERRLAKAINFGLMYGMSAFGLSRQLGIERDEASEYIKQYFARFAKVREFIDSIRQNAEKNGFVETLLGRRLSVPDIHSKQPARKNAAIRAAINAPMQGTASDIIKKAMVDVDAWLTQQQAPARMLLQIHDELIFEVKQEACEAVQHQVKTLMENTIQLKVPLVVDCSVGPSWAS